MACHDVRVDAGEIAQVVTAAAAVAAVIVSAVVAGHTNRNSREASREAIAAQVQLAREQVAAEDRRRREDRFRDDRRAAYVAFYAYTRQVTDEGSKALFRALSPNSERDLLPAVDLDSVAVRDRLAALAAPIDLIGSPAVKQATVDATVALMVWIDELRQGNYQQASRIRLDEVTALENLMAADLQEDRPAGR